MKAAIKIEAIGDNSYSLFEQLGKISPLFGGTTRPYGVSEVFCDRITGEIHLMAIRGRKDYSKANSKGSRGVYLNYVIESGHLYFVREAVSWKRIREYFCLASEDGEVVELNDTEAMSWLAKNS